MAVTLNANTSTGFIATSDTSGVLQLQTGGTTAVTVDASQRTAFVAGTAALPAITTTGDTNTGIYFPAADTIAFSEGGTEAMRLDSAGNVGIGTGSNTILSTLQLQTPAQTNSEWEGKGLLIKDDTTANSGLALYSRNSEEHYIASLVDSANSYLILGARKSSSGNQINVMTLRGSGNVGIGTDTPTVKLDVAGFSKGAIVHRSGSYTNGATTPSVSGATYFVISNSSPTTITNFTNAEDGQIIYLYFGNSNTTIDRTNCYLAGGVNFVSTANDTLALLKSGSYWFEVSRSVNA